MSRHMALEISTHKFVVELLVLDLLGSFIRRHNEAISPTFALHLVFCDHLANLRKSLDDLRLIAHAALIHERDQLLAPKLPDSILCHLDVLVKSRTKFLLQGLDCLLLGLLHSLLSRFIDLLPFQQQLLCLGLVIK